MRTLLIVAILGLCFCNSSAFADNALTGSGKAAITSTTTLDEDTGIIGGIINAIERLDDWIQKNLW